MAATITCQSCGAENPKANRFCDTCGAKLTAVAVDKDEVKAAPKARRAEAAPLPALARNGEGLLPGLSSGALWMLLIVGVGLFLRLWDLGAKPLHHDESIHAWYAYKLFKGDVYKYDPAYHGPFRYHLNALMYFIFGATDFSTRILPAIFGVTIIAFLWQWRSLLGEKGALFAAAMVAISPTWTYVSRFIRDDINMALGELLIVWGLFKYFETRRAGPLFWAAAGLMVAFTSHEGTWIFMGIIGTYLAIRAWWEHVEEADEEHADVLGLWKRLAPPLVAPGADIAGGVAALVTLVAGFGSRAWTWESMGPLGLVLGILVPWALVAIPARLLFFTSDEGRRIWAGVLAIFVIPFTILYSTFFTNMDGWVMGAFDSIAYWLGEQKTGRADQPWQFYLYMLALYETGICLFALLGGLRLYFGSGKASLFFLKLVAFIPFVLAIFILQAYPKDPRMVLVMSAFAVSGAGLAAWSSFAAEKGNHFKVFLLYWTMMAMVMFTIAGERMPWLTLHPLTPLTLVAALYLEEFFTKEEPSFAEHWIGLGVLALPAGFFAVMAPRQVLQALVHFPEELMSWLKAFGRGGRHGSFQPSGWRLNAWDNAFLVWMGLVVFVVLLALMPFIIQRWPRLKRLTKGTYLGLFILALATLSHGTMNLVFRGDGADPKEQHVYVQSSVELVELTAKLDRMSRAITGGPYLKIAVEDLCSWPMSWYLRDFKNAQIGFGPPLTQDKVKDFVVVMTGYDNLGVANHDQMVADSFSNSFSAYPVRFRRWWAPDKAAFWQGTWRDQFKKAWDCYVYREPWLPASPIRNPQFENYVYPKGDTVASPYGSFDAVVWVRKDVEKYFQ